MRVIIPLKMQTGIISPSFVTYVCLYIKKLVISDIKRNKLKKFDTLLGLDTYKYIRHILNYGIIFNKINDCYEIYFDKNIKLGDINCYNVIRFITYGNIETRGYTCISDIFNFVNDNIPLLYKEWSIRR